MECLLYVLVNTDGMPIACVLNMDRTLIACAYEHGWNGYGVCLNADRTFIICAYEHESNV